MANIQQLGSCSQNLYIPSGTNLLINLANPEGTMSRLSYAWLDRIDIDIFRFSANVTPYPTAVPIHRLLNTIPHACQPGVSSAGYYHLLRHGLAND
ncbi:hypothetical protein V1506DRAFT_547336 [Lipomyces tetrasporus]